LIIVDLVPLGWVRQDLEIWEGARVHGFGAGGLAFKLELVSPVEADIKIARNAIILVVVRGLSLHWLWVS
jgi:hypothetical protein